MKIQFSKMQSLGNDFVVIDAVTQRVSIGPELARSLADRHFGIGCDQVLVAEKQNSAAPAEFRFRVFNADGSEVYQCGNGARCLARFLSERGLTRSNPIVVETGAGRLELALGDVGEVTVDMGPPEWEPALIPFEATARAHRYCLDAGGHTVTLGAVAVGNPHAVLTVADVDAAPVAEIGALIERHARFPERANVGFMQILDRKRIRLRVFERGVGETRACGSGACAAVAVGVAGGALSKTVEVNMPGGRVVVHWHGDGHSIRLTGPAHHVFDGDIEVNGGAHGNF